MRFIPPTILIKITITTVLLKPELAVAASILAFASFSSISWFSFSSDTFDMRFKMMFFSGLATACRTIPQISIKKVAKCHGHVGYISEKNASFGNKFVIATYWQNHAFFGKILSTSVRSSGHNNIVFTFLHR